MTNRDMVTKASPEQAAKMQEGLSGDAGTPPGVSPNDVDMKDRMQPGTDDGTLQFPPSPDPLDSYQLKPMIRQKFGGGLKESQDPEA